MPNELVPPCATVGEAAQYLRFARVVPYQLIRARRIKAVSFGARKVGSAAERERLFNHQQA